jgi:hypothetical protein
MNATDIGGLMEAADDFALQILRPEIGDQHGSLEGPRIGKSALSEPRVLCQATADSTTALSFLFILKAPLRPLAPSA